MRARVLVAEDHDGVRRLFYSVLAGLGCAVTEASDGTAAIAAIEGGEPFDVVITDYDMPGKNGLEVLRAVRERLPQAQGILVTAGLPDRERREEATRLADAVLIKPVEIDALRQLFDRLAGGGAPATPSSARRRSRLVSRRRYERIVPQKCVVEVYRMGLFHITSKPIVRNVVGTDVSEVGVGLSLPQRLEMGEKVRLVVKLDLFRDTLEGEGTVVWCTTDPRVAGRFRAGVAWTQLTTGHLAKIQHMRSAMRSPTFQKLNPAKGTDAGTGTGGLEIKAPPRH